MRLCVIQSTRTGCSRYLHGTRLLLDIAEGGLTLPEVLPVPSSKARRTTLELRRSRLFHSVSVCCLDYCLAEFMILTIPGYK